jgi:hypothetical protein
MAIEEVGNPTDCDKKGSGANRANSRQQAEQMKEGGFWSNPNHWIAIATIVAAIATSLYTWYARRQWQVMQSQLSEMRSSSAQTDRLINETHALAANAADEVKKLGALVSATNKQASAASGQLSVMQKQLEAADRPWMAVDASVSTPLTYDNTGVHIGFNFMLSNTGRSPAQNVRIYPELTATVLLTNSTEAQKRVCELAASRTDTAWLAGFPGYTVFPGTPQTQGWGLQLSPNDITEFWHPHKIVLPPGAVFYPQPPYAAPPMGLIGCVDYTFQASSRDHQTGFAFELMAPQIFVGDAQIEPSRLSLVKTPAGNYFAN